MAEREAVYWRLPPGLYRQIKERAADRGVSANAQAVELLATGLGGTLAEAGDGTVPAGSSPGPSAVAPQPASPSTPTQPASDLAVPAKPDPR